MSTRSGVLISRTKIIGSATDSPREVEDKKHLYHHHDGYLQGVGAKLIDQVQSGNFELNFGFDMSCSEFPRSFEDTDDIFNHGDLEYYYLVAIIKDKIVIKAYRRHDWDAKFEDWEAKTIFEGHTVGDDYDKSVVTDRIDLTEEGFTKK